MAVPRGRGRFCFREVLPFAAMVTVDCANTGSGILFKAASVQGMSYKVFVTYTFGIAALALMPLAFIFHRKTPLPPFSFSLLGRIFLLAVLGFTARMLGYKGIEYSSPVLLSAISNITPAITFVLAIIFRMEKLVLTSPRSQAKVLGTIISIAGGLVVVFYAGPAVIKISSPSAPPHRSLSSPQPSWAIGGLVITLAYIPMSFWLIIQAQIMKIYPAEFLVVLIYSICVTIISAPVCFFMEPDLKAWSIRTDIMLLAILYSGIVGSSFGIVIDTWGLRVKGPVYVALFRPFSLAIAAIFGVLFLGDTLYLGSVIGAIFICLGFYIVLWGKARDETMEDLVVGSTESPENTPLLQ